MYPSLCGNGEGALYLPATPSHWASLSCKTVCTDRRDSGATAAVSERVEIVVSSRITYPLGAPIPQNGLSQTGGTWLYPPLRGS